jgi:sugar phosphate permease
VIKLKEIILMLTELLNNIHDFIQVYANNYLNLSLNDKDLHFWIMGIIGIFVFLIVLILSKLISKMPFGITILSFLYTFTFMVVLVFAIEIQQAITNRGNMEFQDAIVGLWGYVVFFLGFAIISSVFLIAKRLLNRLLKKDSSKKS